MKRFLIFTLVLIVLTASGAASAEDTGLLTVSFGDFTLNLDPATPIDAADGLFDGDSVRPENEILFTLYPASNINGDGFSCINAVWNSDGHDPAEEFPTDEALIDFGEALMTSAAAVYESEGYALADQQFLSVFTDQIGGITAVQAVFILVLDTSVLGVDENLTVYNKQIMVSDGTFGTYYFTLSALDEETLSDILDPVINSLVWTAKQ